MADAVFNYAKKLMMMKELNAGLNIYVGLVNNSYPAAIDVDNHKYWGQIRGTYEISGSGYTAGGHALSGPNVQADDVNNRAVLFGTNWTINPASVTARGAVLFQSSGGGFATDPMLCFIDFTTDYTSSAGAFTINWNASGILALT